jgi:hypothetical protein
MAGRENERPGLPEDLMDERAPTPALRRLLDAVAEQRHALAGLIREHQGLHTENLQLVEQLLELPDKAAEESVMASVRYKLL